MIECGFYRIKRTTIFGAPLRPSNNLLAFTRSSRFFFCSNFAALRLSALLETWFAFEDFTLVRSTLPVDTKKEVLLSIFLFFFFFLKIWLICTFCFVLLWTLCSMLWLEWLVLLLLHGSMGVFRVHDCDTDMWFGIGEERVLPARYSVQIQTTSGSSRNN